MQSEEVALLRLDQICDPKFLLRLVNRRSVEYLEMLDSIEKTGLWNSICVRPAGEKYEVIDGFYRLTCCRELRRETIPCIIRLGVSDNEVLAAQIRANAIRPETTPVEFAKQLRRIQQSVPGITMRAIAGMVNKCPQWVAQQLGLLELAAPVQAMVERGQIPLYSAYMLAKVPKSLQPALVEQAQVMLYSEFVPLAANVIKSFMEQVRQGRLDQNYNDLPFTPQAYLRPLREILTEIKTLEFAAVLCVQANATTPAEGFVAALKWAAHLDRESVRVQERSHKKKSRDYLRRLYEERNAEADEVDPA